MKYPHSKALVECTGIWTFEAIWGVFNITLGEWDYKTASKAMIMVTQNSISYTWLIYEIRIYGCWTMVDAIHTQESYRVRCIMMQWWWNTCLNGGVFFCFFFVMFFLVLPLAFGFLASWLLASTVPGSYGSYGSYDSYGSYGSYVSLYARFCETRWHLFPASVLTSSFLCY